MQLSIKQRAFLLGKALTGRFDLKPHSEGWKLMRGILPGAVGTPPTRGTQAQLAGYASMPWVRAIAGRIGHAVAAAPWRLYAAKRPGEKAHWRHDIAKCTSPKVRKDLLHDVADRGELTEIKDHPFLAMLNDGNRHMAGFSVRKLAQIHRDLVGETFWVKERGVGKIPVAIWPIPPHWVMATPTVENDQFRVSYRAWQGFIAEQDMCWFKDPDPVMPYARGTGMAQALSDELELDEYAAKFLKQFFYNGARPDVLIMPKENQTIGESEMQRLEQHWINEHQGFWRFFKPMFSSRPLEVTQFPANFQHLQMNELRNNTRDICLQVWGVPPEVLGVIENSNRATIDSADFLFAKWVIVPRLEEWRMDYQRLLLPEYDDRLILDYESPVEADRTHELEVMKVAPFAFDADEWRAAAGHPPLENDLGKWHVVPNTVTRQEDWKKPPEPKVPVVAPGGFGAPKPTPPDQAAALSDEELIRMAELTFRS